MQPQLLFSSFSRLSYVSSLSSGPAIDVLQQILSHIPCNSYTYLCYCRWSFGSRNSRLVDAVRVLHRAIWRKWLLLQVLRRDCSNLSRRCNLKNKQGEPRKKQSGRIIYTLLILITYIFRGKKKCFMRMNWIMSIKLLITIWTRILLMMRRGKWITCRSPRRISLFITHLSCFLAYLLVTSFKSSIPCCSNFFPYINFSQISISHLTIPNYMSQM